MSAALDRDRTPPAGSTECRRSIAAGRGSLSTAYPPTIRSTPPALRAIVAQLRDRFRKKPIPRDDMLFDIQREWRQRLPRRGRLALNIETSKGRLSIIELRVGAHTYGLPDWDATDLSLALIVVTLTVAPKKLSSNVDVLGLVSRHALARRFQRAADVTDEAFIDDFRRLLLNYDTLVRSRPMFECELPGGKWLGETVLHYKDRPALAVRTYI